jgi:2,5-dihydroxypyridine 5,6-dioxygenase
MDLDFLQNKKINEGIEIILYKLGNLQQNEKLCIVTDTTTSKIGDLFEKFAKKNKINSKRFSIPLLHMHGSEPPNEVAIFMKNSDLILGLTQNSMVHSQARNQASLNGVRYLSLANYSEYVLTHPSLRINFNDVSKKVQKISQKFTDGKSIKICTKNGTNLSLDIKNRYGNYAPGFVNNEILLGSPPDIEANIAPQENHSNGVIVVDGSIPIPEIGKLSKPITLKIKNGYIDAIEGNSEIEEFLYSLFKKFGEKSKILAELGIGFNHKAKVCGHMLIDEGSFGTFHCGFGSNSTIGGKNKIGFHLDFVFNANEIQIDDESIKF